ncbi:polysaccharide pyruvyl transferase family protein [Sphingomonas sp. PAMC 26617]|uniref:polysaccharide pyruvyl transferase family protein n=1 Tax=Sphingomonas sp. PAMC 26617 TaxID=1112216 RepID=UPI000287AA22|nr:polysaccharide pyruvyl transferase family protein [Sphingomonas sp. PAMC 26617]
MTVDRIAAQQAALRDVYRAHVAPGTRYALVDFPDHANVGDSAIWLGEVTLLRALTGRDPDYVSTWHDFDEAAFRRACPEGVLFLHGGGNLGDIWPHHQRFRETILATIRDRPVVQLPQSIQFDVPAEADRFATLVADHPDFALYVRDARSLDFAHRHFACETRLAPDSAYALGPQPRATADCAVLMLLRTDEERRGYAPPDYGDATVVDWLEDDPDLPPGSDPTARTAQAANRVARGLRLLSRGRVLVTDRLHGHILADLLDLPHVALDNTYGKLAAYVAAWPAAAAMESATSPAQALHLAERRSESR